MAELNISERQVGDVTVLDMDGKITIGEGSVALRTAIRRSRAERLLQWRASRTLHEMCADSWRWQNTNPEGYA